jgi:hypothetical protein
MHAQARLRIQELEEGAVKLEVRMGTMTPRPAWATLARYGLEVRA